MKTAKQIKEEKRQTYLKSNQINVNLIKKLDKLPTGEIVIAVYGGKNSKVVTNEKEYIVKQIFVNNEFVRFIEFENRGGKRQNSGAKPKYNEPTKTTAFRVPISKIDEVKSIVKEKLIYYAKNGM